MGFSRQEYWSGLPFPSPGDLPDPGIKLEFPLSPLLVGGFPLSPPLNSQTLNLSFPGVSRNNSSQHHFFDAEGCGHPSDPSETFSNFSSFPEFLDTTLSQGPPVSRLLLLREPSFSAHLSSTGVSPDLCPCLSSHAHSAFPTSTSASVDPPLRYTKCLEHSLAQRKDSRNTSCLYYDLLPGFLFSGLLDICT